MRYYWLKLKSDFFDSKRIKKLRAMAGGDTYLIIYLKMQLKALKTDGVLEFTGIESEFADELALDLDERPDDVRVTLLYLLQYGLCECSDNVHYVLPWVAENTGSEGDSAKRVREYRERKSSEVSNWTGASVPALDDGTCNADVTICNASVTQVKRTGNVEIEKEKEIEIEKDNTRVGRFKPPSLDEVKAYCQERKNNVDPQTFIDFYESKGWYVGKNKMRDWKAAIRTWEKNRVDRGRGNQNSALNYKQTPISETDFNKMIINLEE